MYLLILYKTYYDKGFFNLGVGIDRYVRSDSGPVTLVLNHTSHKIDGRVDRNANKNGTARVHGGAALREWFQKYHREKDAIEVRILSEDTILLKTHNS